MKWLRCSSCYRRIGSVVAHVCPEPPPVKKMPKPPRAKVPSPLKGRPSPLKGRRHYDDGLTPQQRYRQRHPRKKLTPAQLETERERSRNRREAKGGPSRRFIDRAEAKRLRDEGKTLQEIATTLGFTPQAIGQALVP